MRKWHSIAWLSNNEMCGLMRRTSYHKIKNFCLQNNSQSLKSTFKSRFKSGLKGKDEFQSVSLYLTKSLHRCVE